jgi:hypothetical protein
MNHVELAEVTGLKNQVAALTQRITDLENSFTQVRVSNGIRGPVGPRGPAGDISAAVNNAVPAAREAARAEINAQAGRFVGAQGPEGPAPSSELLQNLIVEELMAYQVLNREGTIGALLLHEVEKAVESAITKALAVMP